MVGLEPGSGLGRGPYTMRSHVLGQGWDGGGSLYGEVQCIMGNDYMGPDGSERKSYYLLIWSENPGYLIRDSNTLGYLLPLPFHALYALMYKPKQRIFNYISVRSSEYVFWYIGT